MRVFNEYFLEYKKDYSFEKLFFTKDFIRKINKIEGIFLLTALIFIGITCIYSSFDFPYSYKITFPLVFIFIILYSIYKVIIIPKIFRKELKKNGKPIPHKLLFYKWKSDELINLRIVEIYKGYYQENETTINKLIDISTELINEPIRNFYLIFENNLKKIVKWSCIILPILIAIFIPIFVDLLRFLLDNELLASKEEINKFIVELKNTYKEINKLILAIIGYLFIILLVILAFYKKMRDDSLSKILDYKKELKEYVYILNNIHLLRLQEEKEKIIETKIKKPKNSLLAILRQLFN